MVAETQDRHDSYRNKKSAPETGRFFSAMTL